MRFEDPVSLTAPSECATVHASILVAGAGDHAGECRRERWQILVDDQPDCREVDPEVAMHDHVAKDGQLTPRHLRLGSLDVVGQALARFGERLQVADDRVLDESRSLEVRPIARGVLADPLDALAHVCEQHTVGFGTQESQRNRVGKHSVAQRRMQARFGDNVHTPAQKFLSIQQ